MATKAERTKLIIFFAVLAVVLAFSIVSTWGKGTFNNPFKGGLSNAEKIGISNSLEDDGIRFFEAGEYDKAEKVLKESNDPKYWLYPEVPQGGGSSWLAGIYVVTGRLEKAIDYVDSYLRIPRFNHDKKLLEERSQYETLIKYRDQGDKQAVLNFIESYKSFHAKYLPPQNYNPIGSIGLISTILRLYNTIGDYDAGIKFIDECMTYFKQQDIKKYGAYKPGYVDKEYLKVREAFEQDKAEGFKGCAGAKPGEVCMGKATKALIQSDYFPW